MHVLEGRNGWTEKQMDMGLLQKHKEACPDEACQVPGTLFGNRRMDYSQAGSLRNTQENKKA